jgi:hypothetical protein
MPMQSPFVRRWGQNRRAIQTEPFLLRTRAPDLAPRTHTELMIATLEIFIALYEAARHRCWHLSDVPIDPENVR